MVSQSTMQQKLKQLCPPGAQTLHATLLKLPIMPLVIVNMLQ